MTSLFYQIYQNIVVRIFKINYADEEVQLRSWLIKP